MTDNNHDPGNDVPSASESHSQAASVPPDWQPVPSAPGTPGPGRSRSRKRLIAAGIAAVVVAGASITTVTVLDHRADVAAQERREEADRQAAAQRAAEEAAAEQARQDAEDRAAAELAVAQATHKDCTRQVNPLLNALRIVDARLDVGLTQRDMSALVGKVSIAYNLVDADELGRGTCLRAGVQLENAFNSYNSTVSQWNDCIFDYSCDTDNIMPGMQSKWLRASKAIERAHDLLKSLDPNSATFKRDSSANNT